MLFLSLCLYLSPTSFEQMEWHLENLIWRSWHHWVHLRTYMFRNFFHRQYSTHYKFAFHLYDDKPALSLQCLLHWEYEFVTRCSLMVLFVCWKIRTCLYSDWSHCHKFFQYWLCKSPASSVKVKMCGSVPPLSHTFSGCSA